MTNLIRGHLNVIRQSIVRSDVESFENTYENVSTNIILMELFDPHNEVSRTDPTIPPPLPLITMWLPDISVLYFFTRFLTCLSLSPTASA